MSRDKSSGDHRTLDQHSVVRLPGVRQVLGDAAITVTSLAGGVSADIFRLAADGRSVVVKRAVPRLKVRSEWYIDVARAETEARCLEVLGQIVRPDEVPQLLAYDGAAHASVMTFVAGGRNWKEMMLAGEVETTHAEAAGDLLGRIHRATLGDEAIARDFADKTFFRQGRVDAYHREVIRRHPDLSPFIEPVIERLELGGEALVLGDYSPKNLLVRGPGAITALDFEMAHWGDPEFDVAFCLTHLHAKALRSGAPRVQSHLPFAFLRAWESASNLPLDRGSLRAQIGCLLLARVDGKSTLEYLTPRERDRVRSLGRALLLGRASLEAIADE